MSEEKGFEWLQEYMGLFTDWRTVVLDLAKDLTIAYLDTWKTPGAAVHDPEDAAKAIRVIYKEVFDMFGVK
jgi:hypothetical protein